MKRNDIFGDSEIVKKCLFNGVEYECIKGSVNVESREFPEAITLQTSFTLRFWIEDFETLPEIDEGKIIYAGETYRIIGKNIDNLEKTIKFALGDEYGRY